MSYFKLYILFLLLKILNNKPIYLRFSTPDKYFYDKFNDQFSPATHNKSLNEHITRVRYIFYNIKGINILIFKFMKSNIAVKLIYIFIFSLFIQLSYARSKYNLKIFEKMKKNLMPKYRDLVDKLTPEMIEQVFSKVVHGKYSEK